jgi:predicted nicotinamide N-methyase
VEIDEYRTVLADIQKRNWKDAEGNKLNDIGYKYSKNFWNYYNEKQFCIEHMDLTDVNTVLDIGAGVGLLGVILENIEHLDITVEATDIEETFVGGMYQEIFAHMKTPRHMCEIKNKIPIVLPKHYDMITMTRTVFDREEMKDLEKFEHTDRLFWKTNYQNLKSKKLFPESVQPFLWWPMKRLEDNQRLFSMDKPYRAWYIVLTKEQWENR